MWAETGTNKTTRDIGVECLLNKVLPETAKVLVRYPILQDRFNLKTLVLFANKLAWHLGKWANPLHHGYY